MVECVIVAAAVYIAGAFTPAIGRKIKALFVKETTVLKADVKAEVPAVVATAVADVKKV